MKVKLDQDKCIACGACVAICPENFGFDASGLSAVINEEPTEKTIDAKEACPVYAIEIVEETKIENKEEDSCECEECSCDDECCCCKDEEQEELKEAA